MPPTNSDLAKLADAVEQKANYVNGKCERHDEVNDLLDVLDDWSTARRSALAAGYVECLVSREAVEALREWKRLLGTGRTGNATCVLLARDLDGLLKEPDRG